MTAQSKEEVLTEPPQVLVNFHKCPKGAKGVQVKFVWLLSMLWRRFTH